MLKKIIVGVLLFSVAGAGGAAVANRSVQQAEALTEAQVPVLAPDVNVLTQQGEPVVAAQENIGKTWEANGVILSLDDYGMYLMLDSGEEVYVELGPPDFWQTQGIQLYAGQTVAVKGMENDEMYHAYQVMLANGQVLQIRTEQGRPLWSGGVSNGKEQSGTQDAGAGDGEHTPDPQAQVDEWVTVTGTLVAYQGGNMTISTPEGELLSFQTGQPRFFADQNVSFQVGEEVSVVGFYENEQFMAGDITQVTTGLRVMLRDPNGRPLWAGPGNGKGNGNGRNAQAMP